PRRAAGAVLAGGGLRRLRADSRPTRARIGQLLATGPWLGGPVGSLSAPGGPDLPPPTGPAAGGAGRARRSVSAAPRRRGALGNSSRHPSRPGTGRPRMEVALGPPVASP